MRLQKKDIAKGDKINNKEPEKNKKAAGVLI